MFPYPDTTEGMPSVDTAVPDAFHATPPVIRSSASPEPDPRAPERRAIREQAKAHLSTVDGRAYSSHPDARHGTPPTYDLLGCRCTPCSVAVSMRHDRRMASLRSFRLCLLEKLLEADAQVETDKIATDVLTTLITTWATTRASARQRQLAQIILAMLRHPDTAYADALACHIINMLRSSRETFRDQARP